MSDPPPAGRTWIPAKVEELKTRPGEWEVVRTVKDHANVSSIVARFKDHGADARSRIRDDRLVDVWASWKKVR